MKEAILHHIGYVTGDILATAAQFQHLGYSVGPVLYDRALQVELCYLHKPGSTLIELVCQHNPDSPECDLLGKCGVMPYHLCYEVPDMETAYREMCSLGYAPLFEPVQVTVLDNQRICYFVHQNLGYVELLENKSGV